MQVRYQAALRPDLTYKYTAEIGASGMYSLVQRSVSLNGVRVSNEE